MKLTSAESLADHEIFKGEGNPVQFIHQIQANAIRAVIDEISEAANTSGVVNGIRLVKSLAIQANQLDPLLEAKEPRKRLEIASVCRHGINYDNPCAQCDEEKDQEPTCYQKSKAKP